MRHTAAAASIALLLVSKHAAAGPSEADAPTAADPATTAPAVAAPPGDGARDAPSPEGERRCGCRWRCGRREHEGCERPSLSLSIVGMRPSLTRVSAGAVRTSEIGVGFAGAADSYALDGTTHGAMQFAIGGGQAGFEGLLAGAIDFGYRLDVTEHQGPFARVGVDGRMQGNDSLYFSALEIPRLSLGWQYVVGRTMFEAGGRAGPILTGRFNPGGGVRSTTGAIEFGAFVATEVELLRFEATAMRLDAQKTGDRSPVDVGRGTVCVGTGRVGICGDFSVFRGGANMGAVTGFEEAVATYAGVTVGAARW